MEEMANSMSSGTNVLTATLAATSISRTTVIGQIHTLAGRIGQASHSRSAFRHGWRDHAAVGLDGLGKRRQTAERFGSTTICGG